MLAKAGNGTAIQFLNTSMNSQASIEPLQKRRTEIFEKSVCDTPPELKTYREHHLDAKLDYFCESPTAQTRRLATEHLPWEEQPEVPDDPNVEVFRPVHKRRTNLWNRFMVNCASIRHATRKSKNQGIFLLPRKSDDPAFLRNPPKKNTWTKPDLLGNLGT